MAEHADRADTRRYSAAEVRGQIAGLLAGLVRWAGLVIAIVLVVHVVLTVGGANQGNGITTFIREAADPLALGFKDLFTPHDHKLLVLVNYGIAAVFWLVVTSIVARIIRRLG